MIVGCAFRQAISHLGHKAMPSWHFYEGFEMQRPLKVIYFPNNVDSDLLPASFLLLFLYFFFCQMFSEADPFDQRLFSPQIYINVYCLCDDLMWNIKQYNQNFQFSNLISTNV